MDVLFFDVAHVRPEYPGQRSISVSDRFSVRARAGHGLEHGTGAGGRVSNGRIPACTFVGRHAVSRDTALTRKPYVPHRTPLTSVRTYGVRESRGAAKPPSDLDDVQAFQSLDSGIPSDSRSARLMKPRTPPPTFVVQTPVPIRLPFSAETFRSRDSRPAAIPSRFPDQTPIPRDWEHTENARTRTV